MAKHDASNNLGQHRTPSLIQNKMIFVYTGSVLYLLFKFSLNLLKTEQRVDLFLE